MEKQYIEKKEVVAIVNELPRVWDKKCGISRLEYLKIRINNIPHAADVVEIVRCKDCIHGKCKHQDMYLCYKDGKDVPPDFHEPEWFCANGQRRE